MGKLGRLFDRKYSLYDERRCQVREVTRRFDPAVAEEWLTNCTEFHSEGGCRPPPQIPFEKILIDCTTRQIYRCSDTESYAALSYVWGGIAQPPMRDGKVPLNASAVVNDAITVTREIGFRYIWIDQYCIDQTNHSAKKVQISNMDLIYNQAQVTIVAACGSDASHGLAGVSKSRSEKVDWKRETIPPAAVLGAAVEKIRGSVWSTRGWTFQEAILSRRLLCFQEQQCYWLCQSMPCLEQWHFTPRVWNNPGTEGHDLGFATEILPFGPRSPFKSTDNSVSPATRYMQAVCDLIAEYSQRMISFDEDAIHAIMGVLNAIGNEFLPEHESVYRPTAILGLPLVLEESSSSKTLKNSLVCAMSWFHLHGTNVIRRRVFPSWTWAGWEGEVRFQEDSWGQWNDSGNHPANSAPAYSPRGVIFCVEDAYCTTDGQSEHRTGFNDVLYTSEATTLHFEAPEIPRDWLEVEDYAKKSAGNRGCMLGGYSAALRTSEGIGTFRLALVWLCERHRGRIQGCVWVLRQEGVSLVRSGIICIDSMDSVDSLEAIKSLLVTKASVHWAIS